ncbi:TonB-dependent receptor [Gilvimarinus chinensis]|uniref:TonB-dependent receptor n=1 Tax=Gilvimarinus chinensis TaxID=396005 RepID=UPI00037A15F6|nr:TonB-dependent receptor [Gilvimarinus chinensis]
MIGGIHRAQQFGRLGSAFVVALLPALVQAASETDSGESDKQPRIDEVVLVSGKIPTAEGDYAGSVSVHEKWWLDRQQPLTLNALAGQTPGFNIVDTGSRNPTPLIIRGLRNDSVASDDLGGNGGTVTRYVDNIPLQGDFLPPDMQLLDLEQVEVLKGPQGTLYGSSSLAGIVRYSTAKPVLGDYQTELSASITDTAHSDDLGYAATLVGNLPVGDTFAARLVLSKDEVAGFIDNDYLLTGPASDINSEEGEQARLSLRWQTSERLRVDGSYHYQDRTVEDRQASNEPFTGDAYGASSRFLQPADTELHMANITASYAFDFATATFIQSRYDYQTERRADQTDYLLWLDEVYYGSSFYSPYEDFASETVSDFDVSKDTTELRLTSPESADLWQWLVGAYYSKDKIEGTVVDLAPGLDTFWGLDEPEPRDYYAEQIEELGESAIFAESSHKLSQHWTVTLGGRYYDQTDDLTICSMFPMNDRFNGVEPTPYCDADEESDDGFLWKASAQYETTAGVHWYGVYSEGFRRGGSNALPAGIENNRTYNPDYAEHYELGVKTNELWSRLSLNASVYLIDWKQIQQSAYDDYGYLVNVNSGSALVQGGEVEGYWSLSPSWGLKFGGSYNDARIDEPADAELVMDAYPQKDDRLPGSPREQWNLALDGRHSFDAFELDTLVSLVTVGDSTTALNDSFSDYQRLSGYTLVNVHAGVELGAWYLAADVDNLTDERAITGGRYRTEYGQQGRFDYLTRPRSITLSARVRF